MKMRAMQTVATRPMLHGARGGEFDPALGKDLIKLVRVGDGEGVKLMWAEAKGKVDPNVVDKHGQREPPRPECARERDWLSSKSAQFVPTLVLQRFLWVKCRCLCVCGGGAYGDSGVGHWQGALLRSSALSCNKAISFQPAFPYIADESSS